MSNLGVAAENPVYIGSWTNWSHGKVNGATLTLTQQHGNLLVAFIALFVAFVGDSVFRMLAFFLHLKLATDVRRDGLHNQRQVLLRNSSSGFVAAWSLVRLLWSNRREGSRSTRRTAPLLLVVSLISFAFAVAGVFSSNVGNMSGNEVLVASSACGQVMTTAADTIDSSFQLGRYKSQRVRVFRDLAQECYSGKDESNSDRCKGLIRSRLPRTVETNASCPFDPKLCKTQDKNIRIDTGFLDSNDHLGFNAAPDGRIQFRQNIHCAPLVVDGYAESFNFSSNGTTETYRRYYYGAGVNGRERNYTYLARDQNALSQITTPLERNAGVLAWYSLGMMRSVDHYTSASNFQPIPELQVNGSDLLLFFLSADRVGYVGEVNDPWYSAHRSSGQVRSSGTGDDMAETYERDEAASPLGCVSQFQVCVPVGNGKKECSPLAGFNNQDSIENLTEKQSNMNLWILFSSIAPYTVSEIVSFLGADSLTSTYTLDNNMQMPLPDNQWQLDVQRWFDITLAAMQQAAVDTAVGPSNPEVLKVYTRPNTTTEKYYCKNQKIRSSAYANFSIVGLTITFSIGGIILIIHAFLESIYDKWLWRWCKSKHYGVIEWRMNGALQLHRLAHEEIGSGTWSQCDREYPVAQAHDALFPLNIDDKRHPVIGRPEYRSADTAAVRRSIRESVQMKGNASDPVVIQSTECAEDSIRRSSVSSISLRSHQR
ncbi:hypothetical protein EJ04DRAFT_505057 [Polyplosphaeria fusca]|uniref:Uncharacterized protein n=1 Tax=Polyplosphaeria fusca TaxID=682080 RepID=A0A9P4QN54_9PLEO|nr:hypothetical protein EJ04DRAFT_505057 [Polyplosphaeria fusca]